MSDKGKFEIAVGALYLCSKISTVSLCAPAFKLVMSANLYANKKVFDNNSKSFNDKLSNLDDPNLLKCIKNVYNDPHKYYGD